MTNKQAIEAAMAKMHAAGIEEGDVCFVLEGTYAAIEIQGEDACLVVSTPPENGGNIGGSKTVYRAKIEAFNAEEAAAAL